METEFSHLVEVDKLPNKGRMFKLEADQDTRSKLVERLKIHSLDEFKIEIRVKPLGKSSIYRVEGDIKASLCQPCVVSLESVPQEIEESFSVDFAPESDSDVGEREFVLSEEDDYEPLIDGVIDIAEVATQHLALSLDPYPRSANADIEAMQQAAAAEGRKFEVNAGKLSPFSVLSKLKDQKK